MNCILKFITFTLEEIVAKRSQEVNILIIAQQ